MSRLALALAVVAGFASACIAPDLRQAADATTAPGDLTTATESADGTSVGPGDATSVDPADGTSVGPADATGPADTADAAGPADADGCSGCVIDGACVAAEAHQSGNVCRVCDPSRNATTWSDATDACDDGDPCTYEDACVDGACIGTPNTCDDAFACTEDRCGPNGTCVHPLAAQRCLIDGACYAAGDSKDGDPCRRCDPASPRGWTLAVGHGCDDRDACTAGDTCSEDGVCQGSLRVLDEEPNESATSATVLSGGVTQYPAGEVEANLNPLTDVDWYKWGMPIQTTNGRYVPTVKLSGSLPTGAKLCVYAVCNQTEALFATPVVTCPDGSVADTADKRAGCCVTLTNGSDLEVSAPAVCVGAIVQGFAYASVRAVGNVPPADGAACGDYVLEWGAEPQ